ncbi:MAG: flagellar motor protein MotB, partial [Sphingobacteriales bacterium]
MKKILLSFLFAISAQALFAQAAGINKADRQYTKYAYIDATETYERIVAKGYKSPEVLSKLANSYYFNSQFDKAANWYGELFAMTNDVEAELFYRYAQSLKAIGNYAKSDDMMKAFTAKNQEDLRGKNYSEKPDYMAVIKANSGRYEIGDAGVNTEYSDYGSNVHNGRLYFTSARDTGNFVKRVHKWSNQYFTNIWSAEITADSTGTPKRFERGINTRFHEATPVFSSDGNTMYFTRNNFTDGKKGKSKERITYLKIYKAAKVVKDSVETWENVAELPFNSNEYQTAHPALSADGKWLYFASDMPGG